MTLSFDVLLIEDEDSHADGVITHLASKGFKINRILSWDKISIINCKAKANYFLIIVDQLLGSNATGIDLITDMLSPLDRTVPFILFSRTDVRHILQEPEAFPAIKYIKKEFNDDADKILSVQCLDNLTRSTNAYHKFQIPSLRSPDYFLYSQGIISEIRQKNIKDHVAVNSLLETVKRCTNAIDAIMQFSTLLCRAGSASENISVAIFGSYGRYEARSDSDIEILILYKKGYEENAIIAWNRVLHFCKENLTIEIEGESKIGTFLTSDILRKNYLMANNDDIPGNNYIPAYSPDNLFSDVNLSRYPHLYFRAYQLLSEMTPVFNMDCLTLMKMNLLGFNLGECENSIDVFLSDRMREICQATLKYIQPNDVQDQRRVLKVALFRTIGVLIFKMTLIRITQFNRNILSEPGGASQAFQDLCAPPLAKLIKLENTLQSKKHNNKDISFLIVRYVDLLYRFGTEKKPSEMTMRNLDEMFIKFEKLFSFLKRQCTDFGKRDAWIFNIEEVTNVRDKIVQAIGSLK